MDCPAKTVAGPSANTETGKTDKTAKTEKTGRTVDSYRTPTRILLPKLLVSRDGWKRKAGERKVKLKAATIKIRDLEASRQDWREQAQKGQGETEQLREQLQETRRQLEEAQAEVARLGDGAKKNSTASR